MPDEQRQQLGTCCICGKAKRVRTIVMLPRKCPTPGKGWGCVQCGASPDGAMAVVCDRCVSTHGERVPAALRFACNGSPGNDGRVPIGEFTGEHLHDMARHPEARPQPPAGIGATGRYPRGQLDESDEGELRVAIAADQDNSRVRVEFGKPVAWLSLTPEEALAFADNLRKKAQVLLNVN